MVLTVSSMRGVLCSAIVSERLKMKKFLGIHDWQDIISGIEDLTDLALYQLLHLQVYCNGLKLLVYIVYNYY